MAWTPRPRPQPDRVLLNQAKYGHLVCTRDKDLNPTFRANVHITEPDRQAIFRLILSGALEYERRDPPHRFGVGRLRLTASGRALLLTLPAPRSPKTTKAGA